MSDDHQKRATFALREATHGQWCTGEPQFATPTLFSTVERGSLLYNTTTTRVITTWLYRNQSFERSGQASRKHILPRYRSPFLKTLVPVGVDNNIYVGNRGPVLRLPRVECRNVLCIPRLAEKRVWIGCSSSHTNIASRSIWKYKSPAVLDPGS
jgi:hypothetical protein